DLHRRPHLQPHDPRSTSAFVFNRAFICHLIILKMTKSEMSKFGARVTRDRLSRTHFDIA
ncbi:MAG: hypothetical protein L6R28_25365, partial [Planctomycetes bacterium]|nr:hypothetical protein [Planctomycetota bacterium]